MKRLMSCIAAMFLLLSLQCEAQKRHASMGMGANKNYRMTSNAMKDLKIKRNERRYSEALAHRATKKARESMDVVIVLRRDKRHPSDKKATEKRNTKVERQ
jgi:hypothetical protein